jgi:hypothetical protein
MIARPLLLSRIFFVSILLTCIPTDAADEGEPSILFRHGGTIGFLNPRRDIALGTEASWTPDYQGIVYASSGFEKRLVLRKESGLTVTEEVLPVPVVRTKEEVDWQWSFSPDGRWLAVRRMLRPPRCRLTMSEAQSQPTEYEMERVQWIGFVDLEKRKAVRIPHWGRLVGWKEGKCLIGESYRPLFAVDPERPESAETVLENGRSICTVSPNGRYAVVWDGGSPVTETVEELGGDLRRVLLLYKSPKDENETKCIAASADFSPNSHLLVLGYLMRKGDQHSVNVRVETVDGEKILYDESYEIEGEQHAARPIWAPIQGYRFCYWKIRKDVPDSRLVIVSWENIHRLEREIYVKGRPEVPGRFPLLWSPKGKRIRWVFEARAKDYCEHPFYASQYDLESEEIDYLRGRLPQDAVSWSWACPRLVGCRRDR